MGDNLPKILSTQVLATTSRVKIERVHLRFSNQEERYYERTSSVQNASVMVVPILDKDTFLLVREYAVGFERYCLGFPKGGVDSGETTHQAALREMKEEIGYGARKIEKLIQFAASPSYSKHQVTVFMAEDLYIDRLQGDEPEPLEVVPWKFSQVDDLLSCPDFMGSRSLAALLLCLRKYNAA